MLEWLLVVTQLVLWVVVAQLYRSLRRLQQATAEAADLGFDRVLTVHLDQNPNRDIVTLAQSGLSVAEIARQTGRVREEVDLALRMAEKSTGASPLFRYGGAGVPRQGVWGRGPQQPGGDRVPLQGVWGRSPQQDGGHS